MEQRLRLWSGLVLFTYVATHFLNHSLGLISTEAVEAGRTVFLAFWRSPVGTALLYPALLTHVVLVLAALYRRRHLRLPRWEWVRLCLGLLMPMFLIPHIFGTRVLHDTYGVNDSYAYVVSEMWVQHPESVILQSLLLVLAWVHGCMGVHFWLRYRRWYPTALPWLRASALLLPVFGLLGFAHIGRTYGAVWNDPAWQAAVFGQSSPAMEEVVLGWGQIAVAIFIVAVVGTFLARYLRGLYMRRRGVVRLAYPEGRLVTVPRGTTILEASRSAGIPHASVCGGRGRCSTCRSRIIGNDDALSAPAAGEEQVLRRINAPPNVRLACQFRPLHDAQVYPLLPPSIQPVESLVRSSMVYGAEQDLAILFADIRSFTQFSEHRYPFDVVFLLNRYFSAMGGAVERSGGHLDKFIGDGVMALFGLNGDSGQGCRNALEAAVAMSRALDQLNTDLAVDLGEPLRIGIGIHLGPVIVGQMGYGTATSLTAIGDAVNTASRLESLNKELKSQLVVSEDVATRAGVDLSAFRQEQVEVRGRTNSLHVSVILNANQIEDALSKVKLAV